LDAVARPYNRGANAEVAKQYLLWALELIERAGNKKAAEISQWHWRLREKT
jgi:hypothetical protein